MIKKVSKAGFGTPRPRGFREMRRQREAGTSGAAVGLIVASLLLTGCATTRYVTVPCLTKDQALPSEPPKIHSELTGEADKDLRIVAGSNVRLRAYGQGLRGILEGCRER